MLCVITLTVFGFATVVAPSLLPRGRWWAARPRAALAIWHSVFGIGCVSGVIAATVALWSAWAMRGEVRGTGPGLLVELMLASIMIPLIAALAFWGARLERVIMAVLDDRRAMGALVESFGRPDQTVEALGCEVVVLPTKAGVACSLSGGQARVFVSDGMLSGLSAAEARAVVLHEHAHVRQRHDLWCLAGDIAEAWAPRLPAARALRRATALLVELAADDYARRYAGQEATASALAVLARKYPDTSYVPRARRAARR